MWSHCVRFIRRSYQREMPPKKKFRRGRAKKRRLTWNKYTRQKNLQVKEAGIY